VSVSDHIRHTRELQTMARARWLFVFESRREVGTAQWILENDRTHDPEQRGKEVARGTYRELRDVMMAIPARKL
jgi:hypothetical protein